MKIPLCKYKATWSTYEIYAHAGEPWGEEPDYWIEDKMAYNLADPLWPDADTTSELIFEILWLAGQNDLFWIYNDDELVMTVICKSDSSFLDQGSIRVELHEKMMNALAHYERHDDGEFYLTLTGYDLHDGKLKLKQRQDYVKAGIDLYAHTSLLSQDIEEHPYLAYALDTYEQDTAETREYLRQFDKEINK